MFNSIIVTSSTSNKTDWAHIVEGEIFCNGRFSARNMSCKYRNNPDFQINWKPL